MIVSGLLVTLARTSDRQTLIKAVRSRSELTVGELNDRWLPVALEARDDAHSRELHDWIGAQPGVEFVDVVSVSFEDDTAALHSVPFSALND